jgi:hypothetical protein
MPSKRLIYSTPSRCASSASWVACDCRRPSFRRRRSARFRVFLLANGMRLKISAATPSFSKGLSDGSSISSVFASAVKRGGLMSRYFVPSALFGEALSARSSVLSESVCAFRRCACRRRVFLFAGRNGASFVKALSALSFLFSL